ncbi:EpsG family protein [Myroides marinus]|uniref:EpsG family protein n=1 Tax=Myroides marinus TaxID=703342 RepID=UPI002576C933|nr:EpsG family protein [Myroides marinus]MDM1362585.1 EpsG family protein [Myroides marinus]
MSIYIVFFSLLLLLAILNPQGAVVKHLVIFLLALLCGLRVDLGADYESYKNIFDSIDIVHVDIENFFLIEPLFLFGGYIVKVFGGTHHFFLFFISLIALEVFYVSTKLVNIKNFYLSLFIYFSLFYFQFHFNVIRHGLMCSLVWLGYFFYITGSKRKAYVYILMGGLIQYLGIICFFLKDLLQRIFKPKFIIISLVGAFVASKIGIVSNMISLSTVIPIMGSKISYYINVYDTIEVGVSSTLIIYSLLFLFLRFYLMRSDYVNKLIVRFVLNALFISVFLGILLNNYYVFVERISSFLNLSLVFIIPMIYEKYKVNLSSVFIFYIIVISYTVILFSLALETPMPLDHTKLQYSPYKSIID